MSFTKIISPADYKRLRPVFDKAIENIEKEHIDFFKVRKPRLMREEFDRLKNHFYMHYRDFRLKFDFYGKSDIPDPIQMKCFHIFSETFQEVKQENSLNLIL